jgi:glutaredoxin
MKKYLWFVLLFVFFCGTANADFYSWEDEDGATRITDYPPPNDIKAKNIQFHSFESGGAESLENNGETSGQANAKADVVIYTRNDCGDCDKARDYLKSKNIAFTEYNMDNDVNAAIRRKEIDEGEDVPFAIINRNHVYGFSESVYERTLKLKY